MANITFTPNGNPVSIDVDQDEELLWVLRDRLDVHGLKYGCGMGLCGACTSHIDGVAHRMCITPVGSLQGKKVTTIDRPANGGARQLLPQASVDNRVAHWCY